MIEINLLPEELRAKISRPAPVAATAALEKNLQKSLYLVPLVLGAILLLHLFLAAATIVRNTQRIGLNRRWAALEPQRKKIEALEKERALFSADAQAMQQLLAQRILWAEKLGALNADLPSGIWFNEILLAAGNFNLNGSVISLAKEEMKGIDQFIERLKKDSRFFADFEKLELVSLTRRSISSYEVVDFVLTGILKAK